MGTICLPSLAFRERTTCLEVFDTSNETRMEVLESWGEVNRIAETVAPMIHDVYRHVETMSMSEFHRLCAFEYNTKCAICGSTYPANELRGMPVCNFAKCQWLKPTCHRMGTRGITLAPLWAEPVISPFRYVIWTRTCVSQEQGLCFAICKRCQDEPKRQHFSA